MKIFLTGGAGYIGTHVLVELLARGDEVCVFDNFCNSTREALRRAGEIAGRPFATVEGDLRDAAGLADALDRFMPDAVVHLAGLKSVTESVGRPLEYYDNNIAGSLNLLKAMDAVGRRRLVFSSSATVYGIPRYVPHDERHPLDPVTPYGRTKLFIEHMIADWVAARPDASATLLRYFNPVGAHPSGRIGEDPLGPPANLVPYVCQVAIGKRPHLSVFGADYETRDGTGERDYIHIVDLARAHTAAVDYVSAHLGCEPLSVGAGRGATVLEVIAAFERASGRKVPYQIAPRRPGDAASSIADPGRAEALLGWRAEYDLDAMCRSAWRWQKENRDGFVGS